MINTQSKINQSVRIVKANSTKKLLLANKGEYDTQSNKIQISFNAHEDYSHNMGSQINFLDKEPNILKLDLGKLKDFDKVSIKKETMIELPDGESHKAKTCRIKFKVTMDFLDEECPSVNIRERGVNLQKSLPPLPAAVKKLDPY